MGEITGRQVLAVTCGAFGIIIAVNVLMAYKAVSTFPGLEVDNGYVASQTFDREMAAQKALGWSLRHDYDEAAHELRLTFTDRDGLPVEVQGLSVLVGRTTESREDKTPDFARRAGAYVADIALPPGKWMMHVEAHSPDGTLFRQRLDMFVKG
ncbi:MAG: FixH family protein [Paracoccaceae bacterium]